MASGTRTARPSPRSRIPPVPTPFEKPQDRLERRIADSGAASIAHGQRTGRILFGAARRAPVAMEPYPFLSTAAWLRPSLGRPVTPSPAAAASVSSRSKPSALTCPPGSTRRTVLPGLSVPASSRKNPPAPGSSWTMAKAKSTLPASRAVPPPPGPTILALHREVQGLRDTGTAHVEGDLAITVRDIRHHDIKLKQPDNSRR